MLRRLAASLQKTILLTAAPERFTFASAGRQATLDTALRVGPDGRIVGFGEAGGADAAQVLRLFGSGGGVTDERALTAFCRHGLAQALGPWAPLAVRPRVVVRGVERVGVAPEVFARVLRAAGAMTVEFVD